MFTNSRHVLISLLKTFLNSKQLCFLKFKHTGRGGGLEFQIAQKVNKYLGYFCNNFFCMELMHFAQSGPTNASKASLKGCEFQNCPKRHKIAQSGRTSTA